MADDPSPATPGPDRPGAPEGVLALGTALGAGAWWCEQLFAVTGGWVPTTPEAGVRVHLAELSRVLGDHAAALRRHLPRPTGTDPESWVAAPSTGTAGVVAGLEVAVTSIDRLAGVHRVVVPHLLVAWHAHRRGADPRSDRGVVRTLGHAHADLGELWHDGEGLLEALIGADADAAAAAATTVSAMESTLVTSGGMGLVPLGTLSG
ncbi:hypothetical protein [Iamia sp.]|jgi:hypothetical protein|uniref:hypothetical protein n=1 Tax=Iamia sp. TaxID=2722710 RepID=UPI002BE66854|nr:hypothetical protein [Iamia sp.]HXH58247.1 hypothetical protein [Iamia sp.]